MESRNGLELAQLIIMVDLFRDELYEELLKRHGNDAFELLRTAQNETY
ncbi:MULTISPECIES: hypothetical protein [Mesobacillus]|nr:MULTISPECIES: hypothetical protein [Mesobacillus]MCM3575254.1 hypothetical protein [Mesobacillus subterraneus]UYZ19915.1 hypothetical protein FOF60_12485 [Mesobacillus jeotgali]